MNDNTSWVSMDMDTALAGIEYYAPRGGFPARVLVRGVDGLSRFRWGLSIPDAHQLLSGLEAALAEHETEQQATGRKAGA